MKFALILGGCVAWLALGGCGNPPSNQTAPTQAFASPVVSQPSPENTDELLRNKAESLAKSELSRMSAAALIYRNLPEFHRLEADFVAPEFGAYVKMFRRYHTYEVTDIRRGSSLLYPIEVDILFHYDVFSTKEHTSIEPDALEKCRNEKEYSLLFSGNFLRTYRCDADGNLKGDLPAIPPRPTYWDRGRFNAGLTKLSAGAAPSVPVFPQGASSAAPTTSAMPPASNPNPNPAAGELIPLESFEGVLPPGLSPPPQQ